MDDNTKETKDKLDDLKQDLDKVKDKVEEKSKTFLQNVKEALSEAWDWFKTKVKKAWAKFVPYVKRNPQKADDLGSSDCEFLVFLLVVGFILGFLTKLIF